MTIVTKNSLTLSSVNDGTITHTAYAYSADGKDRFTTVYPNLNLLEGTKDFSGTWINLDSNKWITDGTYKNLVVKKRTAQWQGCFKIFTAPTDGIYTFSAYVKASGTTTDIYRYGRVNEINVPNKKIGSNFDWLVDTVSVTLKAGQTAYFRYEISTTNADAILWTAGHKWELGSTATPYMQSASEVTTADYPSYIGQYSDFTQADSTNPSAYTWSLIRGNDGTNGKDGDPGKVVQQDTEPEERFKDMLWQYTGTVPLNVTGLTAQSNMTYVWNGEAWQIWFLNPANLQAVNAWITNAMIANAAIDFAKINSATIENLSAVNSILGDVKAGKITNEFEYESSAGKTKGTLVIDEIGLRMDYVENEDETKPGSLQVSPSGMTVSRYNTEGLCETASYTQKGMVMSSDVLPMKLSWQGITATVNYERSFNIVYITGSGNWGKFEANKERFFGSLPKSVWPQYEIASGASSMGGAQNMAVKITTDGRIGITSSVAKDNCYAGFSITYRAIPNVS